MLERSWAIRGLRLVVWLGFLPFYVAPFVAVVDHRLGAFLFLGGVVAQLTIHRLFGMAALGALGHRMQIWPQAATLVLLLVGLIVAVNGSSAGAVVLIAGFALQIGTDIGVGVHRYHETMRRPWPQVAPVVDDDDW